LREKRGSTALKVYGWDACDEPNLNSCVCERRDGGKEAG